MAYPDDKNTRGVGDSRGALEDGGMTINKPRMEHFITPCMPYLVPRGQNSLRCNALLGMQLDIIARGKVDRLQARTSLVQPGQRNHRLNIIKRALSPTASFSSAEMLRRFTHGFGLSIGRNPDFRKSIFEPSALILNVSSTVY